MRVVGLKVLKNKLSEYVRIASGGETVLVTDRDKVVAELGPPHPGRDGFLEDPQLANLVRNGWLTPAEDRIDAPPPRRPVAPLRDLLRELDDDRSDR